MDKYVEKLNGFMNALGSMNMDTNRGSDYFIVELEHSKTLLSALTKYHSGLTDKYPPEYWHPQLTETHYQRLKDIALRWFFEHKAMQSLPLAIKSNVMAEFTDQINEMMGEYRIYELTTAPPVWYASTWDEFVFDAQYGRFLIHFSCYD